MVESDEVVFKIIKEAKAMRKLDGVEGKFEEAMELYIKTFNDMFPTFPMKGRTFEEMTEIMHECIANKKDVYKMGYLTLDLDTFY